MKILKFSLITACMMLLLIPTQLKAENNTNTAAVTTVTNVEAKSVAVSESNAVTASEATEMEASNAQLARLEEIKAMDLSSLSKSERKALRDEVKSIDKDQQRWNRRHDRDDRGEYGPRERNNGHIYFIGGGGLLLILLLILLL